MNLRRDGDIISFGFVESLLFYLWKTESMTEIEEFKSEKNVAKSNSQGKLMALNSNIEVTARDLKRIDFSQTNEFNMDLNILKIAAIKRMNPKLYVIFRFSLLSRRGMRLLYKVDFSDSKDIFNELYGDCYQNYDELKTYLLKLLKNNPKLKKLYILKNSLDEDQYEQLKEEANSLLENG